MIYLAAWGQQAYAGPAAVAVCHFLRPCKLSSCTQKTNFEALEAWLDQYTEGEDYLSEYRMVSPELIDRLSYPSAITHVVSTLVNQFRATHHLPITPVQLAHNGESFGSLYDFYQLNNSAAADFTASLARYYQMWWMKNFFHKFHPEYQWDTNYGHPTIEHLNAMLEYGPKFGIHRTSILRNLAKYWLTAVEENQPWAIRQPWLKYPPKWWRKVFPDTHFCYDLTDKEMSKLYKSMYPLYAPEVKRWLLIRSTEFGISSYYKQKMYQHQAIIESDGSDPNVLDPIKNYI